jgi:hypothetical protein
MPLLEEERHVCFLKYSVLSIGSRSLKDLCKSKAFFNLLFIKPECQLEREGECNMFHISILYRQESIFKLIHDMGIFKDMIATICDKNAKNMLHLVRELAPVDRLNFVSKADLQM